MANLAAFVVGLIFSLGLGISGMTQPSKVIGFLDFTGHWDPALVFVMGGASLFYFFLYRVVRGTAPVLTQRFNIPLRRQIDARLVFGAVLFGAGWGIAGFCPGPALTSVVSGSTAPLYFVGAMIAGMYIFHFSDSMRRHIGSAREYSDA